MNWGQGFCGWLCRPQNPHLPPIVERVRSEQQGRAEDYGKLEGTTEESAEI
jgi:hypothetical protein